MKQLILMLLGREIYYNSEFVCESSTKTPLFIFLSQYLHFDF